VTKPAKDARRDGPIDLRGLTLDEIEKVLAKLGEPRYRADQVAAWVFQRGVRTFDEMTDLPLTLREKLAGDFKLAGAEVVRRESSAIDGTEKFLLEYGDGSAVEAVILRDSGRTTGCISTQIGCRFGCSFCATGAMGFVRNLTAGEIVEQILALRRSVDPERVSNLVFMGMGEPLDNYDETLKAIRIANAPWGLGIGARKMTVSTAGIVPGIRRLAQEDLQLNLAVSLNSPKQRLRSQIMPIAERYSLNELMDALGDYARTTGRHVTLEYLLLKDINDSPEMAGMLADLARKLPCKVNLICYNETEKSAYAPPSDKTVERFLALLRTRCPTVVRRVSRGSDIAAGCGQLAVPKKRSR
jgi:23S rRNA (adenine2503-C2)-methyltransferase